MKPPEYCIRAEVIRYQGKAAWHFAVLPKKQSADIKKKFGFMKRGWGSLPVAVTIGRTHWKTSIFPDTTRGAYILPLKHEVRAKEHIQAGKRIELILNILEI